jgi:hypothetical protein
MERPGRVLAGLVNTFASTRDRVGDFSHFPINQINCLLLLLLLLSPWACGQRACVVHHVHSDASLAMLIG